MNCAHGFRYLLTAITEAHPADEPSLLPPTRANRTPAIASRFDDESLNEMAAPQSGLADALQITDDEEEVKVIDVGDVGAKGAGKVDDKEENNVPDSQGAQGEEAEGDQGDDGDEDEEVEEEDDEDDVDK